MVCLRKREEISEFLKSSLMDFDGGKERLDFVLEVRRLWS
jgi:hypothetical protein